MNIKDNVSSKFSLCEIGHGNREVGFAFVDYETGQTITPYCKCKDFFGDMFWANAVNQAVAIYGFKWSPNEDKGILDRELLCVSMRLKGKGNGTIHKITVAEVDNLRSFFEKFNTANKFKGFIVELSDDEKNIIINFDKAWCQNPYTISVLFFLLRLGLTYKIGEDPIEFFFSKDKNFISPNDEMYFKSSKQRIIDFLNGKIDTSQKFGDFEIHQIHNNSGLVNHKNYKVI